MNNSPLRYPGGKSIMSKFFEEVIKCNGFTDVIYSEPYAGGAGSALNLLLNEKVSGININDASIGVYSFWNAVVNESDRFIKKIEETPVSLSEWQKQRAIFKKSISTSFDLGFATFFLSRTNRSGILTAGPIGGQNEEKQMRASYKIDCRYNKMELISRVNKIKSVRSKIKVSNFDALEFLHQLPRSESNLVYLDPPYYGQGKALYLNHYTHSDHEVLATYLKYHANFNWVLSYDNVPEILSLYSDFPLHQFSLSYTAHETKSGSELLTHSHHITMPQSYKIVRRNRENNIEFLKIM